MLCDSVGITPQPNNGTLRLPLKPIGQHKAEDKVPIPSDPVASSQVQQPTSVANPSTQTEPVQSANNTSVELLPSTTSSTNQPTPTSTTVPQASQTNAEGETGNDNQGDTGGHDKGFIESTLDDILNWFKGGIDKIFDAIGN